MSEKRKAIPKRTENQVMDKSEGKCYCGKRGHQIHHIDGNNSNNDFDNLVFVCIDHHDDATIVLSKGKRLIKRLNLKLFSYFNYLGFIHLLIQSQCQ